VTRRNGLLLGIGAAVLAALLLLYALSQTTLTYLLPSPEGIIRRTAIFRPALVASIVNGVALVASLGALVWHLVARPPRWAWWAVAVLLAAGVVADVVVVSSARPLF
jgi:hypothetical protein